MRYVDLLGGRKPHLLVGCRNNLGAETRVAYAPSTAFYARDRAAGRPWVTRLPFPVHVVERVEVIDRIHRTRFVTRYAYHDGYFDGHERELRGFGLVEQWDTEDRAEAPAPAANWDPSTFQTPIHTRTWFHTGAFAERDAIARQRARQIWIEPALRGEAAALDRAAASLPADALIDVAGAREEREAWRALAGAVLRTEVYADDGGPRAAHPYAVTEYAYAVRRVQPTGPNRHAVFAVEERERLDLHYEREPADPRVAHALVLEVDRFGQPVRRVEIGYPRRAAGAAATAPPPGSLGAMLRRDQQRLHVVATHCRYTEDLADPGRHPDVHRLPLPAEEITAELRGLVPAGGRPAITNRFTRAELLAAWPALWSGAADLAPEHVARADLEGLDEPADAPTRRVLAHQVTLYRRDDLTDVLPLGRLEPLALEGQTFTLALTAGWVQDLYGDRIDAAALAEAGYVHLPPAADPDGADDRWWTPSERTFLSADDDHTPDEELAEARDHFFLVRRAVDAHGAIYRLGHAHDLLPVTATDPVGNTNAVEIDWRVLQPRRAIDANGNAAEVAFDALELVAGVARAGKPGAGDGDTLAGFTPDLDDAAVQAQLADPLADPEAVLAGASARIVYDLDAYLRTRDRPDPAPVAVYTITRETHASQLAPGARPRCQHALVYGDGLGRELQRKLHAEPGPLVDGGPTVAPRWVSSGWTVYNNKHAPVQTFEPFFSTHHGYQPATRAGVATTTLYDSADRAVAIVYPDGTWDKLVVGAWKQEAWDRNDTVAIADPRTDPDVGGLFRRLLGDGEGAWRSWHARRIDGDLGPAARAAALQTEAHASTPRTIHFDALGRPAVVVENDGADGLAVTRTAWDAHGQALASFDALGRRAIEACVQVPDGAGGTRWVAGIDLGGRVLYQATMDGGGRRELVDIGGETVRSWNERGHRFRIVRDGLRRPTHRWLAIDGGAERLIERSLYGESRAADNACGRVWRRYDGAGLSSCDRYDFKGNLTRTTRRVAIEYGDAIDWSATAGLDTEAALDAATAAMLSVRDVFTSATTYDALDRPIQSVTPHRPGAAPCVLQPRYHAAGLLDGLDVWLHPAAAPAALLDPATATLPAVRAITYNARGDRTSVTLGNGTITTYAYDDLTFRLAALVTTRPATLPADQRIVQALAYTYDPVGNVTRVQDDADLHGVVFFRNRRVEPSSEYVYDARYRLRRATGRQHVGLDGRAAGPTGEDDAPRAGLPHPGDGDALDTYVERYRYDPVGNLLEVVHALASGTWTRDYHYEEASRLAPGETGNRLTRTGVPTAGYAYDAHGNATRMPHLPVMRWDEVDRLRATARQVVIDGAPETTYYTYTAMGERLRKVTDRAAPSGQVPRPRSERLYLGVIELYRELSPAGETTLERETLRLAIGAVTTALVETRTTGVDPSPRVLVRYQCGNHLGSAVLELGADAGVISYEEYFPYGSTALQTHRSPDAPPKRYRYTGKERDEESGLYYYGARYYASWLGRWTSPDPSGTVDGLNLYAYVGGNPIRFIDPDGRETKQQRWLREFRAEYPKLENVGYDPWAGPRGDGIMTDAGVRVPSQPGELLAPRRFYERRKAAFLAYQGFIHYAELVEAGHDAAAVQIANTLVARTGRQVPRDDELNMAKYANWSYRAVATRNNFEFAMAVVGVVVAIGSLASALRRPPPPRGSVNGTPTNSATGEINVAQRGSVNGQPTTTASGEINVAQRGSVNGRPANAADGELTAKPVPPPPPDPKAPGIVADSVADPQALWGKSAEEVAAAFNKAGFPATVKQSGRGSMQGRIVAIQGHQVQQVQVHPGGGRHQGAYVKVSSDKGIVKVVDPATYKATPGERATILNKRP